MSGAYWRKGTGLESPNLQLLRVGRTDTPIPAQRKGRGDGCRHWGPGQGRRQAGPLLRREVHLCTNGGGPGAQPITVQGPEGFRQGEMKVLQVC